MKLRLALAFSCLVAVSHAEKADEQSMYRISSTEPITVNSSSARTSLLPNTARGVRISANTDMHMKIGGVSVTATVSDTFIPAYSAEYFKINPTDGNYVALIRDTADGKAWVDVIAP